MLRLKLAGQYVDLTNDFSFTMNMKSPLFGEAGSYSYPFKLPRTLRNSSILSFPHRVENTENPWRDMAGEFEWNGITLFRGIGRLRSAGPNHYEGILYEGNGDFYYQLKKKMLQHIDMGEMVFADENAGLAYLKTTINGYYPTYPLSCPLFYNPDYFDPPTSNDQLKYYNYHYPTYIFRRNTDNTNDKTIIVPMLYLKYVLSKIFSAIGYTLNDQVFTHTDHNRLVLYNATNANDQVPEDYTLAHLIFNLHVPRMSINDFLKGLCNYQGFAMLVNPHTETVSFKSFKDIITDQLYEDYSANIIEVSQEYEDLPAGFQLSIDTADKYMDELRKADEATIKMVAGTVATADDLPQWPLAEIGTFFYVEDENQFYRLNFDKTWTAFSAFTFWTYFLAGSASTAEKIDTTFSTIEAGKFADYGKISGLQSEYRDIIPRLFFAKNAVGGTAGPTAHNSTTNISLVYVAESQMLKPQTNWTDWMIFRRHTKLVKITRQMTFNELRTFDFSRKIMVNGRKYMVKNIQLSIKKDRIMPALIECYLCP